jgi:hypothetical protein
LKINGTRKREFDQADGMNALRTLAASVGDQHKKCKTRGRLLPNLAQPNLMRLVSDSSNSRIDRLSSAKFKVGGFMGA